MKSITKLISLLMVFCLICLNLNAAPVDKNTAHHVATNFFAKGNNLQLVTAPTADAPYFIYNVENNGG